MTQLVSCSPVDLKQGDSIYIHDTDELKTVESVLTTEGVELVLADIISKDEQTKRLSLQKCDTVLKLVQYELPKHLS